MLRDFTRPILTKINYCWWK